MQKDAVFYKEDFLSHRNVTKELTEKIDTDNYGYRPTDTSRTAEELVTHMLTSFHQFACMAAAKEPEKLHEGNEDVSLNELADRYTEASVKVIESMDEEALEKTIDLTDMLGTKLPAWRLLEIAIAHEINHKGNLFVYVRELGYSQLPMYVKM